MKKEDYIKKRSEDLKGIPKYRNSPIQRKNIAIREWIENNGDKKPHPLDLDGDGDFDRDDVSKGAKAMRAGRDLKK